MPNSLPLHSTLIPKTMGLSKSSIIGKWKPRTTCRHSYEQLLVTTVNIAEVRMVNKYLYWGYEIIRRPVNYTMYKFFHRFGYVELHDLTHEAVEIICRCEVCGRENFFKIDFNSRRGPKLLSGKYRNIEDIRKVTSNVLPRNFPFSWVEEAFNEVGVKEYNVYDYNCAHYAAEVVETLVRIVDGKHFSVSCF